MKSFKFIILLFVSQLSFSQIRLKDINESKWIADQTLADNKTQSYKLTRVEESDSYQYGSFITFSQGKFSLFYTAWCGNDCFWSYSGKYEIVDYKKLVLNFETYSQSGDCEIIRKKYEANELKPEFTAKWLGDTLVLIRN
jgi:hypothetical protein